MLRRGSNSQLLSTQSSGIGDAPAGLELTTSLDTDCFTLAGPQIRALELAVLRLMSRSTIRQSFDLNSILLPINRIELDFRIIDVAAGQWDSDIIISPHCSE